eukprot:gene20061-26780_t
MLLPALLSGENKNSNRSASAPPSKPTTLKTSNSGKVRGEKARGGEQTTEACWRAKRYAVKFGPPPCVFLEYEDELLKRRVRAGCTLAHMGPPVRKLVLKLVQHIDQSHPEEANKEAKSEAKPETSPNGGASGGAAPSPKPPFPSSPKHHGESILSPAPRLTAFSREADHLRVSTNSLASVDRFSSSTGNEDSDQDIDGDMVPEQSQHSPKAMRRAGRSLGGRLAGSSDDDIDSALSELEKELNDASLNFVDRSMESAMSLASSTSNRFDAIAGGSPSGSFTAGSPGMRPMSNLARSFEPSRMSRQVVEPDEEVLELEVLELEVDHDADLNKVTQVELDMAKARMDEDYLSNQLKPGDDGFEYDKQSTPGDPGRDPGRDPPGRPQGSTLTRTDPRPAWQVVDFDPG